MTFNERRQQLVAMHLCLREAQAILNSESDQNFICHSIGDTSASIETQERTRRFIMRALSPNTTLYSWLINHNEFKTSVCLSQPRYKRWRNQWINQLVRDINLEIRKL